jgi:hypothetical protein
MLFGLGISRSQGVFLNTNGRDGAGNPAPEIIADLELTIPGFDAQGRLGFLQLRAQDDPAAPSRLGGRILKTPAATAG